MATTPLTPVPSTSNPEPIAPPAYIVTIPTPPAEVPPESNPEPIVPPPPVVPVELPPAEVITTSVALSEAEALALFPEDVPPASNPENFTGVDSAIINNTTADAIAVTGLDAQIAANARQDAIVAEQQTVSQASLTADQAALEAAAPDPQLDPFIDPAILLEDQINEQLNAENPAQVAATSNAFDDKKVPDEPNLEQAQATSNNFADKKIPDEPVNPEQAAATTNAFDDKKLPDSTGATGLTTAKAETAGAATKQDTKIYPDDWRVRLSLAPSANYLYKSINPPGILLPLVATDGVIFPYTPNIQVAYAAHYDPTELTHSNYKIFQYKSSSVDNITITCDFTAQDTAEANYLLAVIHFFRSVTKMFYGKDENPMRGIPPPLCYLTGLGQFQFDQHPLAITSFNYTLPTDVDYVRASSGTKVPGGNTGTGGAGGYADAQSRRMAAASVQPGGKSAPPNFNFNAATNTQATYVPTKMQISITAVPIVSRKDISDTFSLEKYATGSLLQGSIRGGGGIW